MNKVGCCLLAALTAAAGCMDMHGLVPAQRTAKNAPAAAAPAAPSRPPVTEDQVTEANASATVLALTEELNREASSSVPAATSKSGPGSR